MPQLHALIVDDQVTNVDVLSTLLTKEGIAYTAVYSIRQIAEVLDRLDRIDIVFLDLEFPSDSGFRALGTLKNDPRLDGVPIVAYTVHTSEINEIKEAGFDSLLGKPLNAKHFANQIERILKKQPVWEV